MDPKLKIIMIGIGIIILMLVSGCVERAQQNDSVNKSSPYLFFPTQKESVTSYMDALLSGKLEVVDEGGCLRVGGYLLVWSYGFSASISSKDKTIHILDDKGNFIAQVGDKIKVGGGECAGCTSKDVAKISAQLPNERCPGPYWIVAPDVKVIQE
ncbi:MAG: hypothetical protein BWK75_03035 [Candidatus Altiarchaeales archaeon A3]|nr:MAG: hypothetical protein BWK75_03035 [Candidatus Altiarchaeales archaeon A3]